MKNSLKKYYDWRPYIWTGDLLEWDSYTILGNIIQWFTGQDVNHTGIVVRYTNFDTERVYTLEALAKGVYPNLITRRLESFQGRVYWLQLKSRYDAYRPAIAREAMQYVGINYDYGGLFKQAFSRVSMEASAFWCSELCYYALIRAGVLEEKQYKSNLLTKRKKPAVPYPGEFSDYGIFKKRICIYDSNQT